MNSPFTDFIDEASETLTSRVSDFELKTPLVDYAELSSFEFSNEEETGFINEEESENMLVESELSATQLSRAVEYNEKYKKLYKWGDYIAPILLIIKAPAGDFPGIILNPNKFAQVFADWQNKNGYRTTTPGVLGLNNWTYFQKKLGLHNLSNKHKIDIGKAISDNHYYEKRNWGGEKENVYKYLADSKILKLPLPLNDEYFAYAIADFQALKGLKVDGILGPITFASLQKTVPAAPSIPPVTLTPSRWRTIIPDAVQSPVETYVNGNEAFKEMAKAIKTANGKGHFIYLLSGWVAELDFCLSPNEDKNLAGIDTSSSFQNLLKQANADVEIKILSWNNPKTLTELSNGEKFINELRAAGKNAIMFRDNFTYGTEAIKDMMSKIQGYMKALSIAVPSLNSFDFWNEKKALANAFPNQGSHHEKILVVNGSEGLIAFCGGMDINANRVIGLKGFCCGSYLTTYDCDLEKDSHDKMRSKILDDVHCKVKGRAAETLLQRFIDRWNLHLSQYPQSIPKMPNHVPGSNIRVTADTPYIKVLHTFNHPVVKSIRDRSILNMVERVIKNARKSIVIECQYMISPEIASWLNKAVHENENLQVSLYTQDDEFANELMFAHYFRSRFRNFLYKGLDSKKSQRIKLYMLDPLSDPPNRRRVHSKTYIIDDELAIIGSANCNRRSMTFDSETSVVIFQDGEPSRSIVKTMSDRIRNDRYNKWIGYKENFSKEAMDFDVKIQTSPYFVGSVGIASIGGGIGVTLAAQTLLANLSLLLREIIDPHPDGEPIITKEVESELAEFDNINDTEMIEEAGPFKSNVYESPSSYETSDNFSRLTYDNEDELMHRRCSCRKKTNEFMNTDDEVAEAIEQLETVSNKTCEGRTCWAKSVLNKLLGLNLPLDNTIDGATRQAIADYQAKNNLSQTRTIDAVTERALLEAEAIQKQGTAASDIINAAKTRIEDWTTKGISGVKTKPQHILNSFRDPRKIWAFVLHQMAFKRMGRVSRKYSDPESYINTGAHFCILFDGRIIQLHPLSRMIWHGNCVSPRSVAVEFEGNFPNVKGRWWVDAKSTVQNKDVPTQAQYDAGKFLTRYLKLVLGTTHILAHRQSSDSRENDPGPDIWYNVGQWAVDNLGLNDGGPTFKCGTGNPILPEWKTWGNKAVSTTEYIEESDETEWQSEDEDFSDDLTIDPEIYYESDLSSDENSYEESYPEMEDFLNDLPNAVAKNRYYADKLGWNQYHDRINDFLLPYSGQQNVSLGEDAFAQAVAAWQQQQGFAAKDCDGIIGPNTWARMRSFIVTRATTASVTQVTALPPAIDPKVVARLKAFSTDIENISRQYGLNPNVVRGIIAAESGGNPNSGSRSSGYKGLMQAERTTDQLQAAKSIEAGVTKFIKFRDKILNPWLVKLHIGIPQASDENYLKACLSCYNAGPVTAMKAIQYANAAGDWRKWLSAEYYLRALLFSGGYDKYSSCNQGLSGVQINAARAEGLKYKFKTSGWRTEPDPPAWSSIITVLNPVTRCWIETKFKNTPGYLERFINYFKYFESNPQASQPEVADELIYEDYSAPVENLDDEDLETRSLVSFEDESDLSQTNWVGQDNEDMLGYEEPEYNAEIPTREQESFVEQILQFLKSGVIADQVTQFLRENYFNLSLLSRFASGQIWNEDHLALEILFHRNPKLKPTTLDKLPELKRLRLLTRLTLKHKRELKVLVNRIVRPVFGNPINFHIGKQEPPCQVHDLRAEIKSLGPLKGGVTKQGKVWYKRDAASSPRKASRVDSIVIHHMAYNIGNDVKLYKKVGAHYIVLADGQIAQLYDELDFLNSSNGFNPRCISIEFAGNFPDVKYSWWPSKAAVPDRCYLTPSQIQTGRCLLSDLKARFPDVKYLYAHRQSYSGRGDDPGPDVWFNIAEWAISHLGFTDRLPLPKIGDGQIIPDSWRRARPSLLSPGTSPSKEFYNTDEIWNEVNEEEAGYELMSDEFINEWGDNEMLEEMFKDSEESFETEEQVMNWSRAIELNRSYGVQLGWSQYYDQINNLLLPYSGQQNVSLSEEAFAQAVAAWQQQQGLTPDGVIGPNIWSKMKVLLKAGTVFQPVQRAPLSIGTTPPSVQNIFDFNRWHAQKIIDSMNAGIIGTNFNSRDQLEKIIRGEQVLNVNPQTKIIQILPIMYHIAEQARSENCREIIFGSFIRPSSDGKCTGHCAGKCIDINHIRGSFETSDATEMVNRILRYLLSLPLKYKSSIGFGMPLQGSFFGRKNLTKFKGIDPSNLIDTGLQVLVRQLGYVFPDNNNHIHIQVNWLKNGLTSQYEVWSADPKEPEMENFTLAQKIDAVRSWKDLLLYKVSDKIVEQLRKRNMYIQYAHNQSYSNDLNTDFYSVRILKYPTLNGVQMDAQSLIKYIRLNINNFVDTSYCDFNPYNAAIDTSVWRSENPLGAVLKLDIKGPDNASVVVSWVGKYGWQFSTIYAPDTGEHPVSGHREFYIINKPSDGKGPRFAIKGLDMMSTGVAGLGFPIFGAWGFAQGDALWKSMQSLVFDFINSNSGTAIKEAPYSERVEWRFVYRQYKYLLEQTFGKGAGSAENSSFFDIELEEKETLL